MELNKTEYLEINHMMFFTMIYYIKKKFLLIISKKCLKSLLLKVGLKR